VAVAVAEVPAIEELLFEDEDVVVIRVEDMVGEDVVLMLEETEVEDCEVVESTELLLLEELTLRLDERLLDRLLDRLLERLFDRLLEMLLEMLLKQLRGHDALVGVWLELVEVIEGVWIVLLDETDFVVELLETEVVETTELEVLEDFWVELEVGEEDLTLLVDVV